jgi:hypothetical protein
MIVSNLMEACQVSLKQRGLPFEKPESASTYKLSFQLYMEHVRDVLPAKPIHVLSSQFRA